MAIQSTSTPIVRPRTTLIPRTIVSTRTSTNNCCPISNHLKAIHVEVKKIESLLKTNADIARTLQRRQQIQTEVQNRKLKEKNKERKPSTKGKGNIVTPPTGGGGIFQSINQFLLMNLLGLAAPKLIQYAPQISWVIKNIIYFSKFISLFTTEFFKNFVKSIHFAYRVYDGTRKVVKNIGGENFQKTFDDTASILNKFLNAAVIVGLTVASSGSDGFPGDRRGRRGRGRGGGGREEGRRGRTRVTSNEDARNPFRSRPEVTTGGETRGPLGARPRVTVSGETKLVSSGFRNILGKIEIVGPLIGFILDLIMGEPVGRAAAGAVGSMIGMGIAGALVGAGTFGIGAIVGGMIGGWLGDLIGTSLYDAVAPMFGWQVATQAQGGAVGNKKTNVSVPTRRTKARSKPSVQRFNKVQPGKNVGGEQEIKKLYPDPDSGKQASPYKALVRTSEILKKNSFSALMAAGVDLALGQNVDKKIFRNFADQLNYMVESSYDPDSNYGISSVNRQVLTAATGGKIPVGRTGGMPKSNFSDQLYDSMVSMMNMKSNDIFSEIRKNLSLTGPTETAPSPSGGGVEGGSPNLIDHANAKEVYNYLTKDLGFTPEAASGILGNLLQESGAIDPRQRQKDGDGKGIIQWDTTRWGRLLNWARANNKDPYKLRTQLEWMVLEMKERGTYGRIKNLRDVRAAVDLFEGEMEKAGVPMMEKRYSYAANAYASFVLGGSGGRTGQFASGAYISSKFDPDKQQTGLDMNLAGGIGTPIYAPRELIYRSRGTDGMPSVGLQGTPGVLGSRGSGFGYYGAYYYKGADGRLYEVLMGHFKNLPYKGTRDGEIIPQGTLLGYQGASGRTIGQGNGPYPHISLHINGVGFRATQPMVTEFANLLLNYNERRGTSAVSGRRSSGGTSTSRTRSTPGTRPRSNAQGEYQGNNDNASTSTTPQSTNIAQLAPNQSGTSSAINSVTSNKTYSDVATNTILLVQPVVA